MKGFGSGKKYSLALLMFIRTIFCMKNLPNPENQFHVTENQINLNLLTISPAVMGYLDKSHFGKESG
jgi:hypothetical protein